MMRQFTRLFLFIISVLIICLSSSCKDKSKITSIKNSKYLAIIDQTNPLVIVQIRDLHDNVIFEDITNGSSYSATSIKWISEDSLLLSSSDVGDTIYEHKNDNWEMRNPCKIKQPDGDYVVSISVNKKQKIIIASLTFESMPNVYYGDKLIGDFKYSGEYYDCIKWLNNDEFVIWAEDGEHIFNLQEFLSEDSSVIENNDN